MVLQFGTSRPPTNRLRKPAEGASASGASAEGDRSRNVEVGGALEVRGRGVGGGEGPAEPSNERRCRVAGGKRSRRSTMRSRGRVTDEALATAGLESSFPYPASYARIPCPYRPASAGSGAKAAE